MIGTKLGRYALAVGASVLLVMPSTAAAGAAAAHPAAAPACTISGGPGPDILTGTPGPDVICGLGGNDVITGDNGDDILIGGLGNDTLEGQGDNDTIDGGPGVDTCVQGAGVGSITNCEALAEPSLSIADATVAEGNPGDGHQLVFAVTLASPLGVTATVDYTTVDGTAHAPGDYTATTGTLTFAAGDTAEAVIVPVTGDATYEPDETLNVVLSNPVAASLGDATATGTITNDDPQFQLNIANVQGPETKSTFPFAVTLTPPSPTNVYVQYQTIDETASSPADYAGSIGVLEIPAGATTRKISIPIVNDTIDEPTEIFAISLSDAVGATIINGTATGTIHDDDSANLPSLTIANAAVTEGNGGSKTLNFTATLNEQSGYTLQPFFSVSPGTARLSYDYSASSATATIAPGHLTAVVSVPINGDTTPEHDETFTIKLTGGSNLVLNGATATGTILNDDAGPIIDFVGPGSGPLLDGAPSVSADGRYVAMITYYTNRGHTYWVVTVTDRSTGAQPGYFAGAADLPLSNVKLSGDGQYVAFSNGNTTVTRLKVADDSTVNVSPATDATLDGDGNLLAYEVPSAGVSLHRFDTAATTPVSSVVGATQPVISADGSHIAFDAGDGTIAVYNVATTAVAIASLASDSTPANANSADPTISADGRYVAFSSTATNLVAGDDNANVDVFRRDLTAGTTIRVSVAGDGSQIPTGGSTGAISNDGAVVAFLDGTGQLFVRTVGVSTVLIVTSRWSGGALSGDGHTVVFASTARSLVDGYVFRRHVPEVYTATL